MTHRSALIVILRCFIIFLGFQAVMLFLGGGLQHLTPYNIIFLIIFFVTVVLYLMSSLIVDLLTPGSNEVLADQKIGLQDLQSIAFSAVGAFICYNAVSDTFSMIYAFASSAQMQIEIPNQMMPMILKPIVDWPVGLLLLFGGNGLRKIVFSARSIGTNRD